MHQVGKIRFGPQFCSSDMSNTELNALIGEYLSAQGFKDSLKAFRKDSGLVRLFHLSGDFPCVYDMLCFALRVRI